VARCTSCHGTGSGSSPRGRRVLIWRRDSGAGSLASGPTAARRALSASTINQRQRQEVKHSALAFRRRMEGKDSTSR